MASESDSDDSSDTPVRHIYVKSDAGMFSFDGYELEFQDHRYATNIAQYLPLLEPPLTKEGAVATRQQSRRDRQPDDAWWAAQCVFRGLSSDGSVADLQSRLRGHEEDPIAGNILDTLQRAKSVLKKKNKEARLANWRYKMSKEEKATADPRRFLMEEFPAGSRSKNKEPLLLGMHFVVNIHETAEELGLGCEYTHAPSDGDAVLQMAKYWVVIGPDKEMVTERVREIERETLRLKHEQREGQQELRRKNKESTQSKWPKQMMDHEDTAVAKSRDWDVSGLWNISCPHIERGWDAEKLTLRIYVEGTGKGPQMFAKFDFGAITGVFRFERQKGDTRNASPTVPSSDDADADHTLDGIEFNDDQGPDESSSDDYDDYDDYVKDEGRDYGDGDEEERRSPTPESFYFGSTVHPSAKYPTWHYRYRGEEVGEGVIEFGSDDNLYSITFGSKGRTLQGTFGGSAFGNCTFTGVKAVGGAELDDCDVSEEWASRNAYAYENQRVDRWY